MQKPVDGIILAAGQSSRMERPKPLLTVGDLTFLERAAITLRKAGCRRTVVVANADAAWIDRAAQLGLDVVTNPDPDSEQIESLRLAIRALGDDAAAAVVLPVDVPCVSEATAAALVQSFHDEPGALIVPFHNTVAGHPVLIGRALFDTVLNQPQEEGMRSLIMDHARDLREVKVVDPGILIDIDTPDDYWRFIEKK